jgi:HAD superfamily hydrolase (TIGR01509 family)
MMQGAIFDMDGVLLDNVQFHLEAFRKFGEEQGKHLTSEDVYGVFGRKNEDMFPALLGRELSSEEVSRFEDRKESIYRDLIRPTLASHLVPGLLTLLGDLKSSSIQMAVATSGPPENVEMVLAELGLGKFFSAVITSRQVKLGKPHPEAFLKAAEALSMPATATVVFEDSLSGVKAALAAGSKCVALTTTHDRGQLEALVPDRIVSDFTGLNVRELAALWDSAVC